MRCVRVIAFLVSFFTIGVAFAQLSPPTSLGSGSITTSSFTVSWTNPSGQSANYLTDVSLSALFTSFVHQDVGGPPNATSVSISSGLSAATTYYVRVRATASGSYSSFSSTLTVTTASPTPSAPSPYSASSITTTSFSANWSTAGYATKYYLDVSSDGFGTVMGSYDNLDVGNVTTYSVTGLSAGGTYSYRVRASNATGTSSSSSTESVTIKPATPSTTSASGNSTTSFVANWTSATGATGYWLEVSETNFGTVVAHYDDVAGTSQLVTGLTANTTYYYRVKASNSSGESSYSNVTSTTLGPAPPVIEAVSISTASFTAQWASVSGAASYKVDLSTDSFSSYILHDGSTTDAYKMFGSLDGGTNHYVRVRSVGSSGAMSGYSNTITVLTVPAIPSVAAATDITDHSFRANWSASTGASAYYVDVATDDDAAAIITGHSNEYTTTNYLDVSGLSAATTYYYRVRASNASGTNAVSSSWRSVLTKCYAPTDPFADGVVFDSFGAHWTASTGADSYELDVSTSSGFSSFVTDYNATALTGVDRSVFPLTSGQTYYFRVRAVNASGPSVNSDVVTVPFPPAAPAISIDNATATSLKIVWSGVSGATSYKADVAISNTFSGSSYSLDNLTTSNEYTATAEGGTTYYARVRSGNSVGYSGYSNVVSVLTKPSVVVVKPADHITPTSFTANWTASASQALTEYRLDVSTDKEFGSFVSGYSGKVISSSSVSSVVTVTMNTDYYYRVRAVNTSGASVSSEPVTVNLDKNYIRSIETKVDGLLDVTQVESANVNQQNTSFQFVDGLGRPTQMINKKGSPGQKDIVQVFLYDEFGREARKLLPYTDGTDGWHKMDALKDPTTTETDATLIYQSGKQYQFYQGTSNIPTESKPYAETLFEASPLNRVVEQGAPGTTWQLGSGHTVTKQYLINEDEDVLKFSYNSTTNEVYLADAPPDADAFFVANALTVNKTLDEHQNDVVEYVDKQGRTICKKVKASSTEYASTYYVYDDFGNLVVVLPPEAVKKIINGN